MCGRYESYVDDDLTDMLEMEKRGSAARYLRQTEVFPGTVQPVLYGSSVRMRAHLAKWGMPITQPRIGKSGRENLPNAPERGERTHGGSLINARSETAAASPRFAPAFRDGFSGNMRRVLIPVSAYYEWKDGVRYRIRDAASPVLFLGAIEENDEDGDGISVFSGTLLPGSPPAFAMQRRFVILTAQAEGGLSEIHRRMPLFLAREALSDWLYDADFARTRLHAAWGREMIGEKA